MGSNYRKPDTTIFRRPLTHLAHRDNLIPVSKCKKDMKFALNIAQIVVSTILVTTILLQARGTGLGATFGGEGNVYRTKRGLEKMLFRSTIFFAVIFFALALVNVLVP
jgi:preprotein translocase subunit SecG